MRGGSWRPLQPKADVCNKCGSATIVWLRDAATGEKFPVDVEPSPLGKVVILQDGIHAEVLTREAAAEWKGRKFRNHFETCPITKGYRRARGIPEPGGTMSQGAR